MKKFWRNKSDQESLEKIKATKEKISTDRNEALTFVAFLGEPKETAGEKFDEYDSLVTFCKNRGYHWSELLSKEMVNEQFMMDYINLRDTNKLYSNEYVLRHLGAVSRGVNEMSLAKFSMVYPNVMLEHFVDCSRDLLLSNAKGKEVEYSLAPVDIEFFTDSHCETLKQTYRGYIATQSQKAIDTKVTKREAAEVVAVNERKYESFLDLVNTKQREYNDLQASLQAIAGQDAVERMLSKVDNRFTGGVCKTAKAK